jgi:hypothetical protein
MPRLTCLCKGLDPVENSLLILNNLYSACIVEHLASERIIKPIQQILTVCQHSAIFLLWRAIFKMRKITNFVLFQTFRFEILKLYCSFSYHIHLELCNITNYVN